MNGLGAGLGEVEAMIKGAPDGVELPIRLANSTGSMIIVDGHDG